MCLVVMMRSHYKRTSQKYFHKKNVDLFSRICNYHFSRVRGISGNVFVIITYRWGVYRSPISLQSERVREPTTAVLKLHNWLRREQFKIVYMLPRFCDTYDRASHPVGEERK